MESEPNDVMLHEAARQSATSTTDRLSSIHDDELNADVVAACMSTTKSKDTAEGEGLDESLNGTEMTHYPDTAPVPFITALARFMQAHVFPSLSVTASLMATMRYGVLLCIMFALLIAVVFCVLAYLHSWKICGWNSPSKPRRSRASSASNSDCSQLSRRVECDAASAIKLSKHHFA